MLKILLVLFFLLNGGLYADVTLLISPATGSVMPCGEPTRFFGYANDDVDGDISSRVQWSNGDTGYSVFYRWSCGGKGLGLQAVSATVINSQGQTVTETVFVTIKKKNGK